MPLVFPCNFCRCCAAKLLCNGQLTVTSLQVERLNADRQMEEVEIEIPASVYNNMETSDNSSQSSSSDFVRNCGKRNSLANKLRQLMIRWNSDKEKTIAQTLTKPPILWSSLSVIWKSQIEIDNSKIMKPYNFCFLEGILIFIKTGRSYYQKKYIVYLCVNSSHQHKRINGASLGYH